MTIEHLVMVISGIDGWKKSCQSDKNRFLVLLGSEQFWSVEIYEFRGYSQYRTCLYSSTKYSDALKRFKVFLKLAKLDPKEIINH